MLDQNTDRMWFVIGAVIVGAAIIFIANGTIPEIFATVTDSFEEVSEKATDSISDIPPYVVNDNLIKRHEVISGWLDHEGIVNGSKSTNLGWKDWTSGYIEVEDADYITFTTNGRHHIKRAVFYSDIDEMMGERFINSEPEDTVMVYDVPEDARYIRVSSMNWGTGYFKVERGKWSTGEPPLPDDIYFGQNLLLDSSSFKAVGEVTPGVTREITKEGYLKATLDGSSDIAYLYDLGLAESATHIENILNDGDMYTFSVQIKSPDVKIRYGGQHIAISPAEGVYGNVHGEIGSEWVTFYMTREWDAEDEFEPILRLQNMEGSLYFRYPKLERGVGATAYSKAPEDV